MDVSVHLHGSVSLADPAMEPVLRVNLDDEATVGTLLDELVRAHPAIFAVASASSPPGAICLFAGAEQLRNRKARLRDALRSGRRLAVALMRPIPGG